ncbi:MAG: prolyl oligopeptidase family serine peptidase [Aureliella sp.]
MQYFRTLSGAGLMVMLSAVAFFCATPVRAQEAKPAHQETKQVERPDPAEFFEPREFSDEAGEVLKYRLMKPANYDANDKYPLVIFLHGAGERGDNNSAQLKHGMPDFCRDEVRQKFPCYVLAPQCPKEKKWADVDWSLDHVELPENISTSMRLLLDLVDQMLENAAIDRNRIYICGLSMGGYGSWDALYRRPDFFAAAIPICGGADPATASRIQHIPIWCFHGGEDKVVMPQFSRDMIAALKSAGGTPKYTEYPGVGHDSWTATFANPKIYDWLFSQRRSQSQASKPSDQ